MENKFQTTVMILSLIMIAYIGFCFFDIILHNMSATPIYKDWNLFQILLKNYLTK